MPTPHPKQNGLLAALPAAEYRKLAPHCELVAMAHGDVLYSSGGELTHFYFPITAVISIQYELQNGDASEIASVGNEGILGVALFMGGASTPNRAVVHGAGDAYRMRAAVLLAEFHRKGPLFGLLLRYTQALMTRMSQAAVCNGHHSTVQRLCRWLLEALDHSPSSELKVTQEALGDIIGVRREGITEAAGRLQTLGLISCRRGHIRVLTQVGLELRVCECYGVIRRETARLMALPTPTGAAHGRWQRRIGTPQHVAGHVDAHVERRRQPRDHAADLDHAQLTLVFS